MISPGEYLIAASICGISRSDFYFILQMRIPVSELYDCGGQSVRHLRAEMRALSKTVGFNTTPCAAHGHRLRTRTGHCLRCNPRNIGFLYQYLSDGHVYVAVSRSTGLLKVGLTGNPSRREYSLNHHHYAELNDWKIRHSIYIPERVGEVETLALRALRSHGVIRPYTFNGETVFCQELFDCPLETARRALDLAKEGRLPGSKTVH